MWFSHFAAVLALAVPAFSYTSTYYVSTNALYDKGNTPLTDVACSNGEYGLITEGYTNFDDIHNFPFIGGAPQVNGWNSPYCGSCWNLTYSRDGISWFVNITAINNVQGSDSAFSISVEAWNHLTNGDSNTQELLPIQAAQLPKSACGQ